VTTFTINGVALTTVAQKITVGDDLLTAPSLVGDDVTIPGRDGELDVYQIGQRRRPDSAISWRPHLWIKGIDPLTSAPGASGSLQSYLDNVDAAIRMFSARSLAIVATRPDGSTRTATGHLKPGESMDFTRERSSPSYGEYLPSVLIPAGRWIGSATITVGPLNLATGASVDLSAFAVATAVCTDLTITFGPASNPKLTLDSGWVQYGNVVGAGKTAVINTQFSTLAAGTGTAWTPSYADLSYSPGPRFFEIDPTGDTSAIFTHTGGGTASVTITGHSHYRTS
jgi:hypothetical protein